MSDPTQPEPEQKMRSEWGRPVPEVSRPTALKIPSPWSGDDNEAHGWRYAAWYRLYRSTRIGRHWLGLHDWQSSVLAPGRKHCTWCGIRRGGGLGV